MAVTYKCDTCGQEATSLSGWLMIGVQLLYDNPAAPNPPGGRTLIVQYPDLLFHAAACRDAWCEKAGVVQPEIPEAVKLTIAVPEGTL